MNISAIASASTAISMANVQQSASISVARKAMDVQETQAADMLKALDQALPPQRQLDVFI